MERHTLSMVFPDMDQDQFEDLKESIRQNGQRDPIATYEGQILDGWHRYRCCQELGIEPDTFEFEGDPVAFVLDKNLKRRHLSEGQRAMMVVQISVITSKNKYSRRDLTQEKMADIAGTSRATVARAVSIDDEDLAKEVIRGSKTLAQAMKASAKPAKQKPAKKKPADELELLQENYRVLRKQYEELESNYEVLAENNKILVALRDNEHFSLLKKLEFEKKVLQESADRWQSEAAELKKQVAYWRRRAGPA